MSVIIKVNDNGDLVVPAETLRQLGSNVPLRLKKHDSKSYLIQSEKISENYWATTTASERADDFTRWINKMKTIGPVLSDEALSRENIYD